MSACRRTSAVHMLILSGGHTNSVIQSLGVKRMGEKTQFVPGDKAPNEGRYIEIGENAFHMGINNPEIVHLKKGDSFPDTKNHNRKWKRLYH